MAAENNLKVTISFYKKQCLPVISCITMNKKQLSKQVQKNLEYTSVGETSLDFQRREDQINTVYEK